MNPHRFHLVDLLGVTATVTSLTLHDAASIAVSVVTILMLTPVAITRWRRFLRGENPVPESNEKNN